jgi:hypothetical protein
VAISDPFGHYGQKKPQLASYLPVALTRPLGNQVLQLYIRNKNLLILEMNLHDRSRKYLTTAKSKILCSTLSEAGQHVSRWPKCHNVEKK